MSSAGGLFYHLRALHAARRRWAPFRERLDAFLQDVWAPSGSLVIVGPSAGYCLTDSFFGRFDEVVALEPDPFAKWLLGRRFRRLGLRPPRFVSDDLLIAPLLRSQPGLTEFLVSVPGACVLFSNFLGQICHLVGQSSFAMWQSEWSSRIAPSLAGRTWASFHDRVSTNVVPRLDAPHRLSSRLSDGGLRKLYGHHGRRVELFDHGTGPLFPENCPYEYFHWELEPGENHLIEAVAVRR